MQIYRDLSEKCHIDKPIVLTIGNFDGVHRGHLAVIDRAKQLAKNINGDTAVLTFTNHPSEILRPTDHLKLICSLPHKIQLLQNANVDHLILLPFTKELSQQSPEEFLNKVHGCMSFKNLVLGHDATLGKDRKGDRARISLAGKMIGFHPEYLEPFVFAGGVVSSSEIRRLIQHGQLPQAEILLGRKYSIYGPVVTGRSAGKSIGFPTANLEVENLCVPVFGVYAVELLHKGKKFKAIANLGVAPTVRENRRVLLEVHLLDEKVDLYDQYVEVVFYDYIRSERRFTDVEELRNQIEKDIIVARKILG